ncbi:MAG: hypothetical protein IJ755_03940 [Bacteroidales bacterium]|nr:hypothetical protein [Bacteroidales bacterium]MBR1794431.1 hypothetical protein [Bacteroidales bacterium]
MERRRLYAVLLSAIILPAILLTSFHHHAPVQETDCVDCAHHIPHGHLGGMQGTDDCLLCQFLSISWLAPADEPQAFPLRKAVRLFQAPVRAFAFLSFPSLSTRAPPVVFCL